MITLQDLILETLNIFESEDIKQLEKERMRLYMKVKNWKKTGKDTSELEKQLNDAKKRLSDAKKAARLASKGAVVTPQQPTPTGDDSVFGDLGTDGFGVLDIDSLMSADQTEITKSIIKKFILDNYKISEYVWEKTCNIDLINGEYVVSSRNGVVIMDNSRADSITNGLFKWGKVDSFFVSNCHNIKTLEGSPIKCDRFCCTNCDSLISLEGAPEECGSFNCSWCMKLSSLKGCPKKVDKVYCFNIGIVNLEGLPKTLTYLNCSECDNLTSLKGCPVRLKNLYVCSCKKLTSKKYLPTSTIVTARDCSAFE